MRPHPAAVANVAAVATVFVAVAFVACSLGCYDPKSPNLPPCPEGGDGYTSPAGCFDAKALDAGKD